MIVRTDNLSHVMNSPADIARFVLEAAEADRNGVDFENLLKGKGPAERVLRKIIWYYLKKGFAIEIGESVGDYFYYPDLSLTWGPKEAVFFEINSCAIMLFNDYIIMENCKNGITTTISVRPEQLVPETVGNYRIVEVRIENDKYADFESLKNVADSTGTIKDKTVYFFFSPKMNDFLTNGNLEDLDFGTALIHWKGALYAEFDYSTFVLPYLLNGVDTTHDVMGAIDELYEVGYRMIVIGGTDRRTIDLNTISRSFPDVMFMPRWETMRLYGVGYKGKIIFGIIGVHDRRWVV